VTRDDQLRELALTTSAAIEKARQLNLPTSAYLLSLVLQELSETIAAADNGADEGKDGAA
jgi:hypothetical protein